VQVRAIGMRTFPWILQPLLIILVIAPFAGNPFVERRVEKVLHEVGAQFCAVEVFHVGRAVDHLLHIFGERGSSAISFGVIVRAVEVVGPQQAAVLPLLAFTSLEDPQIHQHLL
jgi:hypothetical protein